VLASVNERRHARPSPEVRAPNSTAQTIEALDHRLPGPAGHDRRHLREGEAGNDQRQRVTAGRQLAEAPGRNEVAHEDAMGQHDANPERP
jgi:hypothetical protein